jgi:peptidoglycan/LPS O-acetylase OafA/YrhL
VQTRRHIEELQSLRGVAALVVAISHMSSVYAISSALRISIDAVFNAHASLIVFFVLSGYVLTASLMRRGLTRSSVLSFYVGRLFRLFPALWAASAIAGLFLWFFPPRAIPGVTFWFALYLEAAPTWPKVILAAFAIDKCLIMPVWTIFIELMGSALMPLMVRLAVVRASLFPWLVLSLGCGTYFLARAPHRLDSLGYMFDFALGVLLASRSWKFFSDGLNFKLPAAVFLLIFFRFLWFTALRGHPIPLYDGYDDPLPTLVEGVAAFFVVGALSSERGQTPILRGRMATWLGDVSYSLYLIHFPVILLVAKLISHLSANALPATTNAALLIAVALPISLLLATLLHRYVEVPGIAWGKKADLKVPHPTRSLRRVGSRA